MIVDGNTEDHLRCFLSNNVLVQKFLDLAWAWDLFINLDACFRGFVVQDVEAKLGALVADEYIWPCNQFLDLVLALIAEGAKQDFVFLYHQPCPCLLLSLIIYGTQEAANFTASSVVWNTRPGYVKFRLRDKSSSVF
ncbi:hypothetical protein D3C86_1100470 [compost metagenome]